MNGRVWTYVISRELDPQERSNLLNEGKKFVSTWTAHENQLEASFEIVGDRIILVKVNEDVNSASGCSIDKLTRFMKEIGTHFNFDPFNRLMVAFEAGSTIKTIHASQVKDLLKTGRISSETVIYNTSVSNDEELAAWRQPLKNTWLKRYLIPA
jgi:hypothetical protein